MPITTTCASAAATTGSAQVNLTVNASARGAVWNRYYERVVASDHANTVLRTAWGRNIQGALQKAHAQAGFQYVRFHGVFDGDIAVYSEPNGTPAYDWSRLDQVYDAIVAAGMRPFVEISFMPPPLASDASKTLHWYDGVPAVISPPKDWNRWMDLMTAFAQHLEQRYGAAEVRNNWYFEVWNESSWMYTLGMGGYNELFGYTARGLLRADPGLKIGGPAESAGGSQYGISSLVGYATNNSIPLGFVSYHRYANDNSGTIADATAMQTFHESILTTVSQAHFAGPVFVTEWGPTYGTEVARDSEISASFVVKAVDLVGRTGAPPSGFGYWTISDLYEEFDTGSNLAYREGNYGMLLKGDPRYPESFDVAKPVFNAFRLLHMLGDVTLSVTGGTTGDGVNAVATVASDGSAVQILVYNHVAGTAGNPAASTTVSLTVNGLPFGPGTVQVRHYVVDHTCSNSYTTWVAQGKPRQPSQTQWIALRDAAELGGEATSVNLTSNSWNKTFRQYTYGASLIVLSR